MDERLSGADGAATYTGDTTLTENARLTHAAVSPGAVVSSDRFSICVLEWGVEIRPRAGGGFEIVGLPKP